MQALVTVVVLYSYRGGDAMVTVVLEPVSDLRRFFLIYIFKYELWFFLMSPIIASKGGGEGAKHSS